MADIQAWLRKFKQGWTDADVESVIDLFTDDVVYYENPSKQIRDKEELRQEWRSVREQEDIQLDLNVFSEANGKFTVQWELEYTWNSQKKQLKGVYLIKLNEKNQCTEFWQYCQDE